MCDADTVLLAWLFQYITFLIAGFIEKAWAKRNMSLYIYCVYSVLDEMYCVVFFDCVCTTRFL